MLHENVAQMQPPADVEIATPYFPSKVRVMLTCFADRSPLDVMRGR